MIRITGSDISGTGVSIADISPTPLNWFHRDVEIPIIVSASDAIFTATDSIEFYADGALTTSSRALMCSGCIGTVLPESE